jgi:hypothetical protein
MGADPFEMSMCGSPIFCEFCAEVGATARLSAYCAMKPPSITNSVPVMNEASSEARNNTP